MTEVKKAHARSKQAEPTGNFEPEELDVGVQILLDQYEGSAVVSGVKGGESSDLQADGKLLIYFIFIILKQIWS